MSKRWGRGVANLIGLTLFLFACNLATPTPDLVATRVAVEKAAVATLTAEAAANQAPTATSTNPAPPTAAPTGPISTVTPTGAASPASPTCTVVAQTLNLYPGPGVAYQPPLSSLPQGTGLKPVGYSAVGYPGGAWIQVEQPAGWVNADPQFVNCTVDPASLPPAAAIPPTPTATITPTPVPNPPTPTPTPELAVFFEPPGGGNKKIKGYVVFPGYSQAQLDVGDLVFRDKLVFRVVAFDTDRGNHDGAGIESITFTILDADGNTVHERTERTPGYCVFGGGEPTCNVWVFAQHHYRWPEPYNDQPIANGDYNVQIQINPRQGDPANWEFNFRIEGAPGQPDSSMSTLTAQIVQTGPGSQSDDVVEALVFQVRASAQGGDDGAGIDRVDLRILKDGQEVYQRTERNAAYCAFGGGEPDCNVWVFAQHGNTWPGGQPLESGSHLLQAIVYAKNGQTATVQQTVFISP